MCNLTGIKQAALALANCNLTCSEITTICNELRQDMQSYPFESVQWSRLDIALRAMKSLNYIQLNLDRTAMIDSGLVTPSQANNSATERY